MDIILKYFPNLSEVQQQQFAALYDLYTEWNSKINVISRKDITNLYEHHVLHSLGIAKVTQFLKCSNKLGIISLVKSDAWFIKNIKHSHKR